MYRREKGKLFFSKKVGPALIKVELKLKQGGVDNTVKYVKIVL
jgi:hypothetical protein